MKRFLSMIAAVLLATLFASAQNGTLAPTTPPEPQLKYKLTVTAQPAEAASTSGSGEYDEGAKVTVRASAKTNYVFKYWMKDGVQLSQTATSFSINMPAENVTYTAVFEYQKPEYNPTNPAEPQVIEMQYPLSLVANPASGGTFNRTSGAKVKEGSSVSIKATPATGYVFVGWYDAKGESLGTNATLSYTMPSEAATLTARFTYNPNSPSEPTGSQSGVDNSTDAVTLTARSYTREYGEANPSFGYDVTNGSIASGTPTISCAATKTSPAGTYDIIIAKGSVSNSSVNLVKGTLTITKAPLTISAGSYTKQEGEANPTFTPTFSGFKNGETSNVLTKQPIVSCTATAASAPGTYPVTVSGAGALNYSITYQNGSLTVTPKPQPTQAEPYVVYNNGTLTFYCDNQRSSRQGTTYDLNEGDQWPKWYDYHESITKVVFDASFANARPNSTCGWFSGIKNLTEIQNLRHLNTDNVTNMSQMFDNCSALTELDLSKFNSAKVTDMSWMFYNCKSLTNINVSNFNTSKVTSMFGMFRGCSGLSILNLSNFNTDNVEDMADMFSTCTNLTTLDVSSFNTSKVGKMSGMFYLCSSLQNLNLSHFNTANVTDMTGMFSYCSSLTCLNVCNFNTANVTEMKWLFEGCNSLAELTFGNIFVTKETTECTLAFLECSSLKTVSFTGDIPATINSKFFEGVGTAANPTTLDVPAEYRDHYAAKMNGSQFFGGYFKLSGEQKLGDLNDDNEVNGTDLVALVNMIMGTLTATDGADINGDGELNGTDYVALVNIIMGTASSRRADGARGDVGEGVAPSINIGMEPLSIAPGENRELTITLENTGIDVTMAQMDLMLPKGLTLTGGYGLTNRTTERAHHLYTGGNGQQQRLMLASTTNAVLSGSAGAILRLTLSADESFDGGDIVVSNVLCTSPDLKETRQQQAVLHLAGTTGIKSVYDSNPSIHAPAYSPSGQRLTAPRKGINIIGGKKVIIK